MANSIDKKDLLVSLREKHGQDFVSASDLEHPSSDFMMRYFTTVLAQLGVDMKGMTNHKLFQSPVDSYRDISHYSQVYMAVKKVLPLRTFLPNFSLLFLLEPKPEDIYYVAAMDNFYDFYFQTITEHLQPRLQKRDRLEALLQEKKQRNMELQHQLNDQAAACSKHAMEQAQAERQILEMDRAVEELREQEQHLETVVAMQKKACSGLAREVEAKQLQQEQLEDQLQAQINLQQVKSKRAEQDRELAEKRSVLQEKTSRQRFLEECLLQETQAMEAVAELVEQASQVEKQKKRVLSSKRKKELVLKKFQAVEKTRNDLEDRKAALEKDIAVQNNICITSRKEIKDLDRDIEDAKDVESKDQQDTLSLENKIKNVEEKFRQKKEEMSILDEMFQKEHDKLYEKVDSMESELKAALKKRLNEM